MGLLTLLLPCPLAGMLVVLALPRTAVRAMRLVALVATGLTLVLGLELLRAFDPSQPGLQFQEQLAWIPQLDIFYHVGVDGLNIAMVLLTVLLGFLACMASWTIAERQKEYFVLYLLLEEGMLGTFLAMDLILFSVFS